ncbi:hypothetical protein KSP39_PZI018182 [Platanthera zijinensis]|uniref:porphobilinogen synthase n=1 Tax=Platanthera zijinensis TaxID=2320716 RepID=A0AAP0B4G2_9ASPA
MASVFSLVLPCIPRVERGAYGQKCRGSKFFVRKTRKHAVIRACSEQTPPALHSTSQEITMTAANFVLPLFIHEGEDDVPNEAMPDCNILGWRHGLLDEVYKARDVGVKSFLLLPALKPPTMGETFSDNDLIPRTICLLKDKYHDIVIYTDVALDPYSCHGFDGVIMNDETVHQLCKQAVSHARAGADVVKSSDMMDGHARAIRTSLNEEGFHDVSIMSCASKYVYNSPIGGPLDSCVFDYFVDKFNGSFQMDRANCKALIEIEDISEGVDILLANAFLHIVGLLRDNSCLPIAAYQQSSGEYSMLKFGGRHKLLDEEKEMMQSLLLFRMVGADIILTHFARQAAALLAGEK